MASEFVADASERIVIIARSLGISIEVAGKLATEWQGSVIADWGGERAYIGKSNEGARAVSQRRAQVLRDHQAGERNTAIARKRGISDRYVRQILAEAGTALP